jgi:c-di-GMP-binding flagellar brake protein YcgR
MKFGDIEFERRVFPRFTLRVPFTYQLESKATGQGVTGNASQGGLLAYLPERVQFEDRIRIKITLTEQKAVREVEALTRVAWVQETPGGVPHAFKLGLEFVEITAEALGHLKSFEQVWLEQGS